MNTSEASISASPSATAILASHPGVSLKTRYVMAAFIASAVPLAVFLPTLWNGFVWDDQFNFEMNSGYRGLGWSQLQWMLTATVEAHWIPVTWLTFGVDYVLWGMNPAGYHLGNLVLHAVNAALFFVLALRLLRLATPSVDRSTLITGALAASLFFSIHPLRTESVAWITERRDVLSGLFFLVAVLAYLRAHDSEQGRPARWMLVALVSFQLAVLSKAIVITLPLLLILLDIYPLRRLDAWPMRWIQPLNRRVLLEKLPFLPMAIVVSLVATSLVGGFNRFTPLPLLERVSMVMYSFSFYLWKTIVPTHLSPLYEFPARIDPHEARFIGGVVASVGVTIVTLALARRWPAGLAAWLAYVVMVAPMSGLKHTGVQLVADRYSYLSCMPWALLFGAGVCLVVRAEITATFTPALSRLISIGVVTWLIALAVLASHQTTIWRTSEILWRHAVDSDPRCFVCQHNLGTTLLTSARTTEAIAHLERAVELRRTNPSSHAALVVAYLALETPDKAYQHLDAVARLDPELAGGLKPLFVTTW